MLVAEPLAGALDAGTSVSGAFQARSVFSNPAALAFETALNGANPSLALLGSGDRGPETGHLAAALALGGFGLGYERVAGGFSRIRLASAFAWTPWLYTGLRVGWQMPAAAGLRSFASVDVGLQLRRSRYVALGAMVNGLNEPAVGGVRQPSQYVFGVTARPPGRLEETLEGSFDVDTSGDRFGERWGWMTTVRAELSNGVRASLGYHSDFQWQLGLRIDLDRVAVFGTYEPSGRSPRAGLVGVQSTLYPRERSVGRGSVRVVDVGGNTTEKGRPASLFSPGKPAFAEVLRQLRRLEADRSVRAVELHIDRFPLGLAAAEEFREAIARIRASGKTVTALLGSGGVREYWVASAAERIVMEPASELRFPGFRASRYFFRGTLDKLGVEASLLARGRYKSAPEAFTRKESSPEAKEVSLEIVDGAEKEFLAVMTRSGRLDPTRWRAVLERAFLGAEEAKRLGLVDEVMARARWEAEHRASRGKTEPTYRELLRLPRRLAIVAVEGTLLDKPRGGLDVLGGTQATAETFAKELEAAAADPLVDGIVVRVASGGGEIGASHAMAEAVLKAKKDKPVYVSMGDVAASGGYYLAAPASKIFASPTTLTGSIGVFLGSVHLEGLYEKIGLRKETLSRAPLAEIDSEARRWGAAERAVYQRRLDEYYGLFTAFVAAQRKLSAEAVEKAAQGRVWLGRSAQSLGLVDGLGGLDTTLDALAAATGNELARTDVRLYRRARGLFDLDLSEAVGVSLDGLPDGVRAAFDLATRTREPFWFYEPLRLD